MSFSLLIKESDQSADIDQSNIFDELHFAAVKKELKAVVVTPVCDLAQQKTSFLHFCAVLNFEKLFPQLLKKSLNLEIGELKTATDLPRKKRDKIERLLNEFLNNNLLRYHWLGKLPTDENYWYIDYQLTACINIKNVSVDKRIAILQSPLRESVIDKYSTYMGRVGLPWEKEDREQVIDDLIEKYI